MVQLNPKRRIEIQKLYKEGVSIRNIAKKLKCGVRTVQRWKNRGNITRNQTFEKSIGRSTKATPSQLNKIKTLLKRNKFSGSRKLLSKIAEQISLIVSDRTLRSYGEKFGYVWGSPKRIPMLSEKNKKDRLDWAKRNLKTDWKTVIFSDEKIFRAGCSPYGMRYMKGERPTFEKRSWVGQLNIWYGIQFTAILSPQIITGTLDSEKYIEVLRNALPWSHNEPWIFLQDNAPAHKSQKTRNWLSLSNVKLFHDFPP